MYFLRVQLIIQHLTVSKLLSEELLDRNKEKTALWGREILSIFYFVTIFILANPFIFTCNLGAF